MDWNEYSIPNENMQWQTVEQQNSGSFHELPLPIWEGSLCPISITPYSVQGAKSHGKFQVYLEDDTTICLYASEIRKWHIKENCPVEGLDYTELMQALCKRARGKAMFLLKDRDRMENEIRKKLKQYGYPEMVVEDTIAYLYHYRYLDDMRCVKQYFFQNRERKSTRQIIQELKGKGVSGDLIEQVLELEEESNQEEQAARMLYEKYCKRKPVTDFISKQKAMSYLMNKGFSWETVSAIVKDSEYE